MFLSYSREDSVRALAIEEALEHRGMHVWRDVRSIAAGERWFEAVEKGVRGARAVVVLITQASARSEWVTYEYALATGARIPVVAVLGRGVKVPSPVQQFHIVEYSGAQSVARKIDDGIQSQSRLIGKERASTPKLVAKFREVNGELCPTSRKKTPALWLELWIEHAPPQTKRVAFEIPDLGFRDRKWTVSRTARSLREFLTEDMNSYGDVEIWARGFGPGVGAWATTSRLYEALVRFYRGRATSAKIRSALRQILEN